MLQTIIGIIYKHPSDLRYCTLRSVLFQCQVTLDHCRPVHHRPGILKLLIIKQTEVNENWLFFYGGVYLLAYAVVRGMYEYADD